jgi:hypothetical protein
MRPETSAGLARAAQAVEAIRALLGDGDWSLYGMGSLGYGNYVPGWSDLDLDIVLPADHDASPADLADKINQTMHADGFTDVDVKCFRLTELTTPGQRLLYGLANRRVMLVDSARHLYGRDIRAQITRPGLEELRAESRQVAADLAAMPDDWWATRPLDDLAAILALPARLVHTASTGQVVDKTTALESALNRVEFDPVYWPWLSWALACRFSEAPRRLPTAAANEARRVGRSLLRATAERLDATR